VLALSRRGATEIAVVNRTVERAVGLCEALGDAVRTPLKPMALADVDRALRSANTLVNATSVGMAHGADEGRSPIADDLLRPDLLVCDIVANPLETPLLAAAARAGGRTLSGLPMLVEQGAASFELWTGREAPRSVMYEAAERAMATNPA
jgi:shikimate dehydrogenase